MDPEEKKAAPSLMHKRRAFATDRFKGGYIFISPSLAFKLALSRLRKKWEIIMGRGMRAAQPEIATRARRLPDRVVTIDLDEAVVAAVDARDANRSREINRVLKQYYGLNRRRSEKKRSKP